MATGGTASTGASCGKAPNSAIALITALGRCNRIPSPVTIDEVTTVATVWALNQFMDSSGQGIGTSITNQNGLSNAVATALNNLVDVKSGLAPGPSLPHAATAPTAKLNTLADIAARCVESSSGSSIACKHLFADATAPGGSAPATTLAAAVDIARNPDHNVSTLFGLATPNSPFAPSLSSAPADWFAVADFVGGGLSGTNPTVSGSNGCPTAVDRGIAVDESGDVWISNIGSAYGKGSVTELSPTGAPLSPSTGFTGPVFGCPTGIAIEPPGNVLINSSSIWMANFGCPLTKPPIPSSVLVFPAPDPACHNTRNCKTFTAGIDRPNEIAIGSVGNVWVVNFGTAPDTGFVTKLPSMSIFSGGGIYKPESIAVDAHNNIWITNSGCKACMHPVEANVAELNSSGKPLSPSTGYASSPTFDPLGIAIDAVGDAWVADSKGNVTELDASGKKISPPGGFTGEGIAAPINIAIDGSGNAWVTDDASLCNGTGSGQVEEFASSGKPLLSCGVSDPNIVSPEAGVAIDSSGNVWVADDGSCSAVELIGAATPVRTPLFAPPMRP